MSLLNLSMSTKSLSALLLCLALSTPPSWGDTSKTVGMLLDGLTAQMAQQCEIQKMIRTSPKQKDRDVGRVGEEFSCDCMPIEIDKAFLSYDRLSSISEEEFLGRVRQVQNKCGARVTRKWVSLACVKDFASLESDERDAFCTCYAEKLDGLTDEQVTDIARNSYEEYNRASAERVNGIAGAMPKKSELLQSIESNCKALKR